MTDETTAHRGPGRRRGVPVGINPKTKNPGRRKTAVVQAAVGADPKAVAEKLLRDPWSDRPEGRSRSEDFIKAPDGRRFFAPGNRQQITGEKARRRRAVKEAADSIYAAKFHIYKDEKESGGKNANLYLPVLDAAVGRLCDLAFSPQSDPKTSLRACMHLLDFMLGKPR